MSLQNYNYIIGIDEVGRGPLAGPVTVTAFCVEVKDLKKVHTELEGITDSKQLTPQQREHYYEIVKKLKKTYDGINFSTSYVSASVIDKRGIVYAINLALTRSLQKLELRPQDCYVCLDGGLHAPSEYAQETVTKGDQKIWQISAASVIAKVVRDKKMVIYAQKYPDYGFERHKGYGTKFHREQIQKKGITEIHRKTWIKT